MKQISLALIALFLVSAAAAAAQNPPSSSKAEQELLALSKTKWRWMAERNVDSLAALLILRRCSSIWAEAGAPIGSSR